MNKSQLFGNFQVVAGIVTDTLEKKSYTMVEAIIVSITPTFCAIGNVLCLKTLNKDLKI